MAHIFGIQHLRDQKCAQQGCDAMVCKAGTLSEVTDLNGKLLQHPMTHRGHIHFRVPCAGGHPNDLLYPEDVELHPLVERIPGTPAVLVREY